MRLSRIVAPKIKNAQRFSMVGPSILSGDICTFNNISPVLVLCPPVRPGAKKLRVVILALPLDDCPADFGIRRLRFAFSLLRFAWTSRGEVCRTDPDDGLY